MSESIAGDKVESHPQLKCQFQIIGDRSDVNAPLGDRSNVGSEDKSIIGRREQVKCQGR
jgi:hypothetical protein